MTNSTKKTEAKSETISFGKLGSVTILESSFPSELEVYAKYTVSQLCSDGTYNAGPTFSDDAGCGTAVQTPYTAPY